MKGIINISRKFNESNYIIVYSSVMPQNGGRNCVEECELKM